MIAHFRICATGSRPSPRIPHSVAGKAPNPVITSLRSLLPITSPAACVSPSLTSAGPYWSVLVALPCAKPLSHRDGVRQPWGEEAQSPLALLKFEVDEDQDWIGNVGDVYKISWSRLSRPTVFDSSSSSSTNTLEQPDSKLQQYQPTLLLILYPHDSTKLKMKFTTTVLALATTALAAPSAEKRDAGCTFGTYECTADYSGIQICNVQGAWELVGGCPTGTSCEYLPQNGFELPFCTNTPSAPTPYKRDAGYGYGYCSTPGQYSCLGYNAIQVCDTSNKLERVGGCPKDSHCDYLNGIPFCVV